MCKGLIGKKLGMIGSFTPDGRYIPITVILAGPCVVTQVKSVATDGYNALQLGFGEKKGKHVTKPLQGHMKKAGEALFSVLKEFSVDNPQEFSLGQKVSAELFKVGERVDVTGTTKGRGFSGVIRRHGFSGGRKTHGSKCHKIPGSIGSSAWPSRVFKGKRLPGHYGVDRKTIKGLEISDIRPDKNLILVKGAVPGPVSGFLEIKKPKYAL
jgi:large subunit ribosomal protein L3